VVRGVRQRGACVVTRDEALAEARRRWGAGAFAYINGSAMSGGPWASVGYERPGSRTGRGGFCYFNGPTWEAAFADADRREAERGRA